MLPFVEIDDREICRQRASAVGSVRMPDRKQPVERVLPMGHENYILVDALSGEKDLPKSRQRTGMQEYQDRTTGDAVRCMMNIWAR